MVNLTQTIPLTIKSRDEIVYQGDAIAISGTNGKGPFDILANHGNFISVVNGKLSVLTPNRETQEINVDEGVLRVFENKVEVFLGVRRN